ncbi:hypothetical protein [Nitrosomonas sp. Nm34]|uniref:hypothetical protein n=1 Tax=Nitrosomonas sp. Nm34 TaxID=1881055 RepID=UPI0008DEF1C9|nr:hypothetical protein [Nitrosomonas sp. Nm34]SFI21218.1 hypothetical protein SAMN05428978_100262 [Nitrosomonas sp. Nm34]
MSEINEFIADLVNHFSLSTVTDRSWFEIASILAPSVIFIPSPYSVSASFYKKGTGKSLPR